MYGTTDGYSSTIGEVMHKVVKDFYEKTNKNKFEAQIAKHDQRANRLRRISQHEKAHHAGDHRKTVEKEPMQMMGANDTIQIAVGQRNRCLLSDFHDSNDYALRDFVDRVKDHVFRRMTNMELTPELRQYMEIVGDCIYEHAMFLVSHQSY
ncbi:hypothetical protein MPER_07054 [Moniliophthora perniciosa FA553]|nr:hypothetical protein MPER_07054 [Moniliophthora perniciosa FA553]